ncbi:hypothetical protein E2562_022799 [Oryza meyeriana var. granulata]|uniref:Uncharacterized protein n=1 Tax=Oryza meyeriana var. granulata TaxID=110450 RepID=A0A6G1EYB6_9ORYZ|nr:hypothetical protein E2562_022799 [Oryza meyeriana var. granulata]
MMSCLRYPLAPAYRARKFEFGDSDEWEALELKRTEFAHHPYRGEDDTFCTVRDTPCCIYPMVTRLARWTETTDDCYEEAQLELSEQQGRLGDLEVDLIKHTHTYQQLEEEHQSRGREIASPKAQL